MKVKELMTVIALDTCQFLEINNTETGEQWSSAYSYWPKDEKTNIRIDNLTVVAAEFAGDWFTIYAH